MLAGRVLLAALLLAGIGAPLLLPFGELLERPQGWAALLDGERIAILAGNTLGLAVGTVLIAVPLGTLSALLLERTSPFGIAVLRSIVVISLFVPLSVYAAGWQVVTGNWLPADVEGWRPWRLGLLPAIWVHAMASVPWVIWIVSLGVRTTDPRLEDDALLAGGPTTQMRWVIWPSTRISVAAAAAWVAVQTVTDTTVTDLMMLRTFSEEVYFQLIGNPAGVPSAVAVTLPVWIATAVGAIWVVRHTARSLPPNPSEPALPYSFSLGTRLGVIASASAWLSVAVPLLLPAGANGAAVGDLGVLLRVSWVHSGTLADSLLWAGVAGLLAGGSALVVCWTARDSRTISGLLLVMAVVAWVTPAPLVGLGLMETRDLLMSGEEAICSHLGISSGLHPLRSALYDQPSPLPTVWGSVIRFFPIAVVLLWPVVRNLPRELLDAAQLDGGRISQWRAVIRPVSAAPFVRAVIAVGGLNLGEVVASKLVQPPGRQSFAQELFNAMHYGTDASVAAMVVLQITATAVICAPLLYSRSRARIG